MTRSIKSADADIAPQYRLTHAKRLRHRPVPRFPAPALHRALLRHPFRVQWRPGDPGPRPDTRETRAIHSERSPRNAHTHASQPDDRRRRPCRVSARCQPRAGTEDQDHRLHRARERPARAVQAGVRDGESRRRNRLGPRLDRRRDGEDPRREGQSARRHHLGPRRVQHRAVRLDGPARAVHAEGRRQVEAGVPQRQEPDDLDRARRVARGDVLQHRRRRQEEPAEARVVGRSRQSRSTRTRS